MVVKIPLSVYRKILIHATFFYYFSTLLTTKTLYGYILFCLSSFALLYQDMFSVFL